MCFSLLQATIIVILGLPLQPPPCISLFPLSKSLNRVMDDCAPSEGLFFCHDESLSVRTVDGWRHFATLLQMTTELHYGALEILCTVLLDLILDLVYGVNCLELLWIDERHFTLHVSHYHMYSREQTIQKQVCKSHY